VEAVVTGLGMTASAVPSGRREGLARLGNLAGSLLAEGARQSARGQRLRLGDLLPPEVAKVRARLLMAILLRQLLAFRLIKTDPNFANYRYESATRPRVLLDFAATRPSCPARPYLVSPWKDFLCHFFRLPEENLSMLTVSSAHSARAETASKTTPSFTSNCAAPPRKSTVPATGHRSAGGAEQVGAQFVLDFRYQRLREYFRRRGM